MHATNTQALKLNTSTPQKNAKENPLTGHSEATDFQK